MIAFMWGLNPRPELVYWHLLPLVAVVSLVYSATRHEQWTLICWRTVKLSVFILIFMTVTLAILWGVQML